MCIVEIEKPLIPGLSGSQCEALCRVLVEVAGAKPVSGHRENILLGSAAYDYHTPKLEETGLRKCLT